MTARALQGVINKLNALAVERGLTFPPNETVSMIFRKRNGEQIEIMLRNKIILSKEKTQAVKAKRVLYTSSRKKMGRRSENSKKKTVQCNM